MSDLIYLLVGLILSLTIAVSDGVPDATPVNDAMPTMTERPAVAEQYDDRLSAMAKKRALEIALDVASEAERDPDPAPPDPYEVDLLARLIYQEAGCDWIPDYVILWVGSVALNRVESDLYPDTLYEVIYDPGQYAPAITGSINRPANERCRLLAEFLLREGSLLPPNVLGQCGWPTGNGIYATYYDEILNTTIYFCYIG